MIGLDTNILLRHLAQDDPIQSPKADEIVAGFTADQPGWVSLATLLELIGATTYNFGAGRTQVVAMIEALLAYEFLIFERTDEILRALILYRNGNADFADCLISSLGRAAGCERTLTFDRKAAKTAGMTLA